MPEYDVTVAAEPTRVLIPLSGLITDEALTLELPPPAVIDGAVVPSGPITAIDLAVAVAERKDAPGVLQKHGSALRDVERKGVVGGRACGGGQVPRWRIVEQVELEHLGQDPPGGLSDRLGPHLPVGDGRRELAVVPVVAPAFLIEPGIGRVDG